MPANINVSDSSYYEWISSYVSQSMLEFHDETCKYAKYLHDARYIYGLYGLLDGLSMAYSTTKYCFDMFSSQSASDLNSSDFMHDWMLTPEGILTMIAEATIMMAISTYANIIEDDELYELCRYQVAVGDANSVPQDKTLSLFLEDGLIKCIAKNKRDQIENFIIKEEYLDHLSDEIREMIASGASNFSKEHLEKIREATTDRNDVRARYQIYIGWRLVRDALKGLKNAYKGIRATMLAAGVLKNDMRAYLLPTALTFGVLSALNRMWYRTMKDERKKMQALNKGLAANILKLEYLSREDAEYYFKQIGTQSSYTQWAGLASQVFGGLIDGLYLYVGALTLAPLSPLAFAFVASTSVLLVGLCMLTRTYGESEYQRKLKASELLVKLRIYGKREESLLLEMQQFDVMDDAIRSAALEEELKGIFDEFNRTYQDYLAQKTYSYWSVALVGLNNGLLVGSAISGIMYVVSAILSMFMIASCPPAFVVACVAASLASVVAGVVWAFLNAPDLAALSAPGPQQELPSAKTPTIEDLLNTIKLNKNTHEALKEQDIEFEKISPNVIQQVIWGRYDLDVDPLETWEHWAEVLRASLSGVRNGQKAVDFMFNPLQEMDEGTGHYRDSTIMIIFAVVYALVFTLVLMLRAIAKELNDQMSSPQAPTAKTSELPSNASSNIGNTGAGQTQFSVFKHVSFFRGQDDNSSHHDEQNNDQLIGLKRSKSENDVSRTASSGFLSYLTSYTML